MWMDATGWSIRLAKCSTRPEAGSAIPGFPATEIWVAFLDHDIQGDSIAGVSVVDLNGKKTKLTEPYGGGAVGLAWSPSGDEVWFTATELGIDRALFAVSLSGKKRLVARVPADLTLQDVLADGRTLLTRDNWRRGLIVHAAEDYRSETSPGWIGRIR